MEDSQTVFAFRAALDASYMRQAQLGRIVGATPRTVNRWHSGELPVPRYVMVILSMLAGMQEYEIKRGLLKSFEIRRHHVFRRDETYKKMATRFHPDVSGRDTTKEMQIINAFRTLV